MRQKVTRRKGDGVTREWLPAEESFGSRLWVLGLVSELGLLEARGRGPGTLPPTER